MEKSKDFRNLPKDSRRAVKFIMDLLLNNLYPLLREISDKLHNHDKDVISDDNLIQIRNVYTLCADQIRKCVLNLFDIIKTEYQQDVYLQETRQCALENLSLCFEKLRSVKELLMESVGDTLNSSDESLLISTMYFVNWIDQTFDVLSKLSTTIYNNKFKDVQYPEWQKELVECVCGLHSSVDELLLSAMTLCKYCLPIDQHVIKARCQVVLRETKTLLSDLVNGDLDTVCMTTETLKLPIKPCNINVLIDVLKDVLYVLETNTNTALLALVVHCFSQDVSPVEMLRHHFQNSPKTCSCTDEIGDATEKCMFIKEFDLYNERLLQISSFAISCSSDQKRILNLRSGLASLEALDPHLVPAVMLSPQSYHASLLVNSWKREMNQIRDNVFLIVDPAAFADKARQMMHQNMLEITKGDCYNNSKTCTVINISCIIFEFFNVYEKLEPDALACREQLAPLLKDLNKVQLECKIVSNFLSCADDQKYDVKEIHEPTTITNEQIVKRLKLLYTLVKRINQLLNPRENDDEFYEEPIEKKNITYTFEKNVTYVHSPRKNINNNTRSIFARTNIRSSTGKFPLAILTKHMKSRKHRDLSFSIKLDDICNVSEIKFNRESSILYYSPLKSKSSLRKAVLCKHNVYPHEIENVKEGMQLKNTIIAEQESFIDNAMSLQITDVLNHINDLTNEASKVTRPSFNTTVSIDKSLNDAVLAKNILRLNINDQTTSKRVWNITVNSSASGIEITSNTTQPSEVNTLERINDLELVESKLSDLKSGQIETSL